MAKDREFELVLNGLQILRLCRFDCTFRDGTAMTTVLVDSQRRVSRQRQGMSA